MAFTANNASISPGDLVNASQTIAQAMDESGQRYVRIAEQGIHLASTGLKGAAGTSLMNKLEELKRMGLEQSARSTSVATNMRDYGSNLGELSAESAGVFNGLG